MLALTTGLSSTTLFDGTLRWGCTVPTATRSCFRWESPEARNPLVHRSGGTSDGETATLTVPPAPGTYPFHCTYHSNMHGDLTVG
ncbi:cupredoxin domain-containing protein [Rhodococcus koreensis]|uniref:cupredoxin domain-containing protein n=1 Tax=Rhodococcus koreensis TaxID=99653 RepID=UPI002174F1FB|nr:cupredoxin domain-containing protein [Rhodococcus koreensis]